MRHSKLWGIAAAAGMGLLPPAFAIYSAAGGGFLVVLAAALDGTLAGIGLGGLIGFTIATVEADVEEETAFAVRRLATAHS
jgi:hypothetical protein